MAKLAIDCKNTTVQFGDLAAVDNVSLELKLGVITGLIGPSGAGKTTLMRAIVGRQKVNKGTISVLGQSAGHPSLRNQVSYKTQEVSAYDDLTVAQNLAYFSSMKNIPRKSIKTAVNEVIELVDLAPQSDQLVRSLSGGQKQRVSLAITLLGNPDLLVLDEPTVGLDPLLRDRLWKLFRAMADKGKTLVISSHVMDEAERCDDLALIRAGQIINHGSPQAMREQTNSKTIEESFLKLARSSK